MANAEHKGTPVDTRQREMPWMSDYPRPVELDWKLVGMADNFIEAVGIAILKARPHRTDAALAEHLGISRAQFSRIRSGDAHFPNGLYLRFCYVVGNWGIYQYRELERQRIQSPGLACALDEDVA